jgi:hypothetical protein
MTKHLHRAAFVAGLLAVGWVAAGYLRSHPLALAMTVLIGAFYVMGALELRRFHRATVGLGQALGQVPEPLAALGDWLATVPVEWRNVVRLRIEGDRVALPGPALAPYLAGLVVLLGMLGTFMGMVLTLRGTGVALERAADLQTLRDSLAAPVQGLGLAFGTSVAGVAASAMLGLMSALCRRDRLQVAQQLETQIATSLRSFTRAHRREAALQRQQAQQAELVPALVGQLQALTAALQAQARQADERLLDSQERFQARAEAAYRTLAASVDQTLRQSLAESAGAAAATIGSAVTATMSGITRETSALHGHIAGTVQQQFDALSTRFEATTRTVAETWTSALAQQERTAETLSQQTQRSLAAASAHFEAQAAALLHALDAAHTRQQADRAAHDEQRQAAWTAALAALAASLQREWQQAGALTLSQQTQICDTLEQTAGRMAAQAEAHARSILAEVAHLVQTAAEAPRAAAEVIAQLRDKLSDSQQRDNTMLEERSRIMVSLNTLLDAVQHTATAQRAAIDQLVASTAAWLEQAGTRFTAQADAESARLESVAAQLTGSAVDVASLGEAFGVAVGQFGRSSEQLMAHLQRIDETLGHAIVRSDEQLAYYVAQAREVIDLSLLSHKQIVDDLQRLADDRARQGSLGVEA